MIKLERQFTTVQRERELVEQIMNNLATQIEDQRSFWPTGYNEGFCQGAVEGFQRLSVSLNRIILRSIFNGYGTWPLGGNP